MKVARHPLVALLTVAVACGGSGQPDIGSPSDEVAVADAAQDLALPDGVTEDVLDTDLAAPDAPEAVAAGPDLPCSTTPYPKTAPAQVTIGGVVGDPFSNTGIAGARLEALRQSDDVSIGTAETGADGSYSAILPTGGVALHVYARVTEASHVTTLDYPPGPPTEDNPDFGIVMVTPDKLGLIAALSGATLDPEAGVVAVIFVDCDSTPLEGVSVTFDPPPGTLVYLNGNLPSATATQTDASGGVFGLNQPPGRVTVTGTIGDVTIVSYLMKVEKGALTAAMVAPHSLE
jgi:hypothetical protein